LYPFIDSNGKRLYFASNKKGGQGGYDIYYVNKVGNEFEEKPRTVNELNSSSDDISYFKDSTGVFFSSSRPGGMGGFDVYGMNPQNSEVNNLGYPLNTTNDEVSVKKINNDFYLTSNRKQNFDIYGTSYAPVYYTINGLMIYKNDSTIVPNHKMYYMDADLGVTIDTLISDENAKYKFTGKPNRNYVFTTLNGDSVLEQFSIVTVAGQKTFDYITPIGGRSPKQIADSIAALLAANEKRRLDSIDALGITTKFVVHYGFDKNAITNKEKFVLDYLLNRLKQLPAANIAIGAFTDCIGSNKYNNNLSVRRAKAVYAYLIKQGLDKNRILTNGYAKKYNIAPCITKSSRNSINAQKDNRRAEIVLSNSKEQDWESLEKARGAGYYKIFNSDSKLPTETVTENIQVTPLLIQKSTDKLKSVEKQKVKSVKNNEVTIKKQVLVIKKDTTEKKKTTVDKTITEVKPVQSEGLSKEDIIKALDSLSNLKKEQDRIVDYLTKRINNKPIEIFVSSDSVTVEIYDNGTHDKDNVTVIYNRRIVVDKQELKVNQPIKFKLKVDNNKKNNELIMVAETLGSSPPNTAVMFITEKSGKRQQVMFNTDLTHNGVVYFIRIGKK
jgi:outer membrane protein OmpA-like peptidoglycan-associated protein